MTAQANTSPYKARQTWELAARKRQRVAGLQALIATHEALDQPNLDYIKELKRRLHKTSMELSHLKI